MFFIFFGNIHSGDRIRKRMMQYNDEARLLLPQDNKIINRLHWDNYAAEKQAKYLYNYAGYPVFTNTSTKYFPGRRGEILRDDRAAGKGAPLHLPGILHHRRGTDVGDYPGDP